MTNQPNTGGPAFPFTVDDDRAEHVTVEWGMTLLDWFAGKATDEDVRRAFVSLTDKQSQAFHAQHGYYPDRAWARYEHAAAMIAEKARREKGQP